MNISPHRQSFAYRRNPAQTIHPSTFYPDQLESHGHGHGTAVQARPIQSYYSTSPVAFQPAQSPVIIEQKESKEQATESASGSSNSSSGFSLANITKYANIDELKGLVDRFGGLEGILSTVTTVQKVVSTVGQIAPMVKVMTGLVGNKSKNNTEQPAETIPARRKVKSTRPRNRSAQQRSRSNVRQSSGQARGNKSRRSAPLTKQQL